MLLSSVLLAFAFAIRSSHALVSLQPSGGSAEILVEVVLLDGEEYSSAYLQVSGESLINTTPDAATASTFTIDSQTGNLYYPSTTSPSGWSIAAASKASSYANETLWDPSLVSSSPDTAAPLSCTGTASSFTCQNAGAAPPTLDQFLLCNGALTTYRSAAVAPDATCDTPPRQIIQWNAYWAPLVPDTPTGDELQVTVTLSNGASTTVKHLAVLSTGSSQIYFAATTTTTEDNTAIGPYVATFVLDAATAVLFLKDAPGNGSGAAGMWEVVYGDDGYGAETGVYISAPNSGSLFGMYAPGSAGRNYAPLLCGTGGAVFSCALANAPAMDEFFACEGAGTGLLYSSMRAHDSSAGTAAARCAADGLGAAWVVTGWGYQPHGLSPSPPSSSGPAGGHATAGSGTGASVLAPISTASASAPTIISTIASAQGNAVFSSPPPSGGTASTSSAYCSVTVLLYYEARVVPVGQANVAGSSEISGIGTGVSSATGDGLGESGCRPVTSTVVV